MFNNYKTYLYLVLLLTVGVFVVTADSIYAVSYNLLAPLPGGTASIDTSNGFITYISQIFWFLLSAAGILAVLVLVFAGAEYVGSAGNPSVINDAKSRIWNAIIGLLLALAAYLILITINPNLINLKLTIPPIPGKGNGGGGGGAGGGGGGESQFYCSGIRGGVPYEECVSVSDCNACSSRGYSCSTNKPSSC
jgi:hypothetical protein